MTNIVFVKFQYPNGNRMLVNLSKIVRVFEDSEGRCFLEFYDVEVEISGTIEDALKNIELACTPPSTTS